MSKFKTPSGEVLQKWYFTFGQNHTHPDTGQSMKDYWVESYGTYDEARQRMVAKYGRQWSMQYSEDNWEDHAKWFPKGRYENLT